MINESLGNIELMKHPTIAFLCSQSVPSSVVLKSYNWAKQMREQGRCVICGNHSQIEKDVFEILLRGSQPLVLALARGIYKKWDRAILRALEDNRLLVISPFDGTVTRVTRQTSKSRNELIISFATQIVAGYVSPNGQLATLLQNKTHLTL